MWVVEWCGFFFFSSRRRHTRSYGDWSSDVCSSDLGAIAPGAMVYQNSIVLDRSTTVKARVYLNGKWGALSERRFLVGLKGLEIGRASCRERGENGGGAAGEQRKKSNRAHEDRSHDR